MHTNPTTPPAIPALTTVESWKGFLVTEKHVDAVEMAQLADVMKRGSLMIAAASHLYTTSGGVTLKHELSKYRVL
jgi:hypothetical protein